jgi:hypothetical protein
MKSFNRQKMQHKDKGNHQISIGDWVLLPKTPETFPVHREYAKTFRKFSGRVLRVVGWDSEGYAWIDINKEVLSVPPQILTLVRRGYFTSYMMNLQT